MANSGLLVPVIDGLLLGQENLSLCNGSACINFANLTPGTLINVYMDSGAYFYNVIFKSFDNNTCTAIVEETLPVTPPSTQTLHIDCTKVETIGIPS